MIEPPDAVRGTNLAIIGAGGWGTALACVLAPRFARIRLWVYEPDLAERIRSTRENDVYLPGTRLPDCVEATTHLGEAVGEAGIVLGVMPSHHARRLYGELLPYLDPSMLFVSATKGLENNTLLRISEVSEERRQISLALDQLSSLTANTWPRASLDKDDKPHVRWAAPSLLGTYALMVTLDLSRRGTVRSCVRCASPFVTAAPQAIYCSDRCRYTVQKQRLRERQKAKRAAE